MGFDLVAQGEIGARVAGLGLGELGAEGGQGLGAPGGGERVEADEQFAVAAVSAEECELPGLGSPACVGRVARVWVPSWDSPPGGEIQKPVTNQVTTHSHRDSQSRTPPDTACGLTCGCRTSCYRVVRNRPAWHARGQRFEPA